MEASEKSFDIEGINHKALEQMEAKRKEIIKNLSDLPPSKRELVIKSVDEIIALAVKGDSSD
ncbi:hypothetical protein [Bacillus sp. FJAT-27245]|uniref:hypothetical protein n=1 Tax=Bacillus sp. FJAT-27245 TaxID=1684144 RepID=UPI0006A760C2|nr:hypothetical protein [Bacillus sp. FJAT-27245]